MGIDIKLITADEAYHDKDGSLFQETGVIVTTPPSAKISSPQHVDKDSGAVFCHDSCNIAMYRVGFESQTHEYKCGVEPGDCQHSSSCPQYRYIAADDGQFQQIPSATEQINEAHAIRKNCERSFNLLKNQTGMEAVRVRSQHATMARCALSSMAIVLIQMAGFRRKEKTDQRQIELFSKAA